MLLVLNYKQDDIFYDKLSTKYPEPQKEIFIF